MSKKKTETTVYNSNDLSDIFDDFWSTYKPPKTKPLKDIFEGFFETEQKALKIIKGWKPLTPAGKAIKKVTENSQSLSDVAQRKKIKNATHLGNGRVRKQRFKQDRLVPLVPRFRERNNTKERIKIREDGTTHILIGEGDKLMEYMFENGLNTPFDLIKAHGKDKKKLKLGQDDWKPLLDVLRSINLTPQEILDYCVGSVQTKKRFLELRLYRNYETNSKWDINNFIKIYRKHLKSKKPLKIFAISDDFKEWCVETDLYFNSDENLRQNIKLMVQAWNKDNPKDKLPLKIK